MATKRQYHFAIMNNTSIQLTLSEISQYAVYDSKGLEATVELRYYLPALSEIGVLSKFESEALL